MEILKCNADYNKVYYVEVNGTLCQCKLVRTESGNAQTQYTPMYVLDVAGKGIMRFVAGRRVHFDSWWRGSVIPSILYESVEDYQKSKPILDNFGSTGNAYNYKFLEPLFKYYDPCNCGGDTITWKWDGCKAVSYTVKDMHLISWTWDENGFHCDLNNAVGFYRTKKECEQANKVQVVKFKEDEKPEASDLMNCTNNHDEQLVECINKAWKEKPEEVYKIVRFLAERDNEETILALQNKREACHDYCQNIADDKDLDVILCYCKM